MFSQYAPMGDMVGASSHLEFPSQWILCIKFVQL